MDKNSTSYTFIFATIMVVVVATLLATAAIGLKPAQDKNVYRNKIQDILKSVNITVEAKDAEAAYQQYITDEVVLDSNGDPIEGAAAFDVDLASELKKAPGEQRYPLFVANIEGESYYIIPMRGKGLWGPIWGYIALEGDGSRISKVYGASFDHKGETPGLGAEINTHVFQQQFIGKMIFDGDGTYKPVRVVKGAAPPSDLHAVSGISGGTITSNGVSEMIERTLSRYEKFFNSGGVQQAEPTQEDASYESAVEVNEEETISTTTN